MTDVSQICEQADNELKQFTLFWFNNGCFIGLILGGLVHKGKILLLFPKKNLSLVSKKNPSLVSSSRSIYVYILYIFKISSVPAQTA